MNEAAKALRKSRRWLQDWLAKNPVDADGKPHFIKVGRTVLFREEELSRVRVAIDTLDRRSTFVYFIEVQGYIKIGIAADWKKRLSALQVSSPFQINRLIVLSAHMGFERDLHEKFSSFHVRGEWFLDCPEIREFIERAAKSKLLVIGAADQ